MATPEKQIERIRRLLQLGMLALLLVPPGGPLPSGIAQPVQLRVQVGGQDLVTNDPPKWALDAPSDQDAVSWLKRAAEAAQREDWKLAADTLERVVDQHGDRTVSLDNNHYYSASRLVQEQIAGWPESGIAAYRLLYDPDATRLLDQAKANYDFDALRTIARRFPMTTPGPAAMNLLATWLIDRRQAREALDILSRLERLPHSHISKWQIEERRVVAYTLAHQREAASQVLVGLRSMTPTVAPGLPEDWPARVERLQRFFEQAKDSAGSSDVDWATEGWPYRMGPPGSNGRTSAIDPVLAQADGWTTDLPGAERIDESLAAGVMVEQARPPVWQAVSDGTRLYVTCPNGLVARDLATFELAWQAFPRVRLRDPKIDEHRAIVNLGGGQIRYMEGEEQPVRLDPLTTQSLYYDYRGEVSTALGLVFVIEQNAPMDEQLPTPKGALPPNAHLGDEVLTEPNALRAYEADTGRAVWSRGRGGPPTDELRLAHFCAAPVACSSGLVVPYRIGGDLWIGVIDTRGELLRRVLLGTGRASLYSMYGTLPPLVRDGTIYVQSGAGLVFAIDEHDLSLRWLTRYEPINRRLEMGRQAGQWWIDDRIGVPQPDQWLTSPPISAGGLVIMTPLDCDQLLAFDVETGKEKWRYPRGSHRYMVGAVDGKVVLAGDKLTAVSIADGRAVWTTDRIQLIGRPLISGDEILAPIVDGVMAPQSSALERFSAASGERIGPAAEAPSRLGNLFSVDGALYSVSVDEIAKYPDPGQTRRLAMERLDRNPSDLDALLRLAWLDTLAEKWDDALTLLDRAEGVLGAEAPIAPALDGGDRVTEYRRRISHQRVAVLLRMSVKMPDDPRGKILKRALAESRRPDDRIEAGLANCDYLDETGRSREGFEQALTLLLESIGQPIKSGDQLLIRSDLLVSERLRGFWEDLSAEERMECNRRVQEIVEEAEASNRQILQMRLADGLGFGPWGRDLDRRLGAQCISDGAIESGIFFLTRARDRATTPGDRLEPLIRLAAAYGFPGEGLPVDFAATRKIIDELEADFSDASMPPGIELRRGMRATTRVADFVNQVRATFPAGMVAGSRQIPEILTTAKRLGLEEEAIAPRTVVGLPDGGCFWDAATPLDRYAEVVPVQLNGEVHGLDVSRSSGRDFWWTNVQRTTGDDGDEVPVERATAAFDAAICGRVAVLGTPTSVSAVGLTTGKSMWAPLQVDASSGSLPQPSVIGIGGIVVAAADSQTLVATYARNDASVIWRRRWPRLALGILRAMDDCLIVVDRDATRVVVLDVASGRSRAEYGLVADAPGTADEQIDAGNRDAFVAIESGVVVRSEGSRLVARDAKTGNPLWSPFECEGIVKGLYEMGGGCIGVCHGSTRFSILNATTGQVVLAELPIDGLSMPPIDVVLDLPKGVSPPEGGRVILFTRKDATPFEYVLDSYSFSKDELHWQRELGLGATVSRQMLRASPEFVAALRYVGAPQSPRRNRQQVWPDLIMSVPPKLEVIDKSTGGRFSPRPYQFAEEEIGDSQMMNAPPVRASTRIAEVLVLNRRIVAVSPDGFFILADESELEASKGGMP